MTDPAAALELREVTKSFGAVVALRSGSLRVEAGSIHGLVGENGAGKSTLVKVVAGVHRRDGGEFLLDGEPVDFGSTAESKAPASPSSTRSRRSSRTCRSPRTSSWAASRSAPGAGSTAARCTPRPSGCSPASACTSTHVVPALGLSIADQQIIEIAKAISLDARVLIMDEPTAALSGVEVERLFTVARRLRDEGRALVFISHRFDEVFALCDTVTVMRDGAYVDSMRSRTPTWTRSSRLMVGREVGDLFPKTPAEHRRARAPGRGPDHGGGLPRRHVRGPVRRDRRPRRTGRRGPQRDRPRGLRCRRLRQRPSSCRQASAAPQPARRDPRRAWRSSPRTGASRAWSPTPPSRTTSPP